MSRVPKVFLTLMQKIQVMETLKNHLDVVDGKSKYHKGYNDIVLSDNIGFPCSPANVANIRKEIYGKLDRPKGEAYAKTQDRFNDIELRLDKIEDILGRLIKRNAGQD